MRIARLLIGLASLASFALIATSTHAATITVTTTEDEQSANGACSLREAVRAANMDVAVDACPAGNGADTIVVPPGTYTLKYTDTARVAGMFSLLELHSPITLSGADPETTVIRGTGPCIPWSECAPFSRLMRVSPDAEVTIQGLTLRDNSFFGFSGGEALGGGILNGGALTLRNTHIVNMSAGVGGGIYTSGTLTLDRATIASNSASFALGGVYPAGNGGGIHNTGGVVLIERSEVTGNAAMQGGGIYNESGMMRIESSVIADNSGGGIANFGDLLLRNAIVEGNRGDSGAGIISFRSAHVDNSVIRGNAATGGSSKGGNWPGACGGIHASGQFTLTHSAVYTNTARGVINTFTGDYMPGRAGGVCIEGSHALIQYTSIYSNAADIAGGLRVLEFSPSPQAALRMDNVTVSGNTASIAAGGLRVEDGEVELNYTTFASNTAPFAAGIHVLTTTTTATARVLILNSLLAAAAGRNCTVEGGAIESGGYNLSSDASCASLAAQGDITNTNPLLGPLQVNWPGMTPTHALLPGSPAIDAGAPLSPDSALTDQRGVARRWGGPRSDIGAFEVFDPTLLRSLYLPFGPR